MMKFRVALSLRVWVEGGIRPAKGHIFGFLLTGLNTGDPTCVQLTVGIEGTTSLGLLKSQVFDSRPSSLYMQIYVSYLLAFI